MFGAKHPSVADPIPCRASLDSRGLPSPRFGAGVDVPTEAGELSKSDLEPIRDTQSSKKTYIGGAIACHSLHGEKAADGQGAGVAGGVHSPGVLSVPALAKSLAMSITSSAPDSGSELSIGKCSEGDRRGLMDGGLPRGELSEDDRRGANDDEWDFGQRRGRGSGVDGGAVFDGHVYSGDDKGHVDDDDDDGDDGDDDDDDDDFDDVGDLFG